MTSSSDAPRSRRTLVIAAAVAVALVAVIGVIVRANRDNGAQPRTGASSVEQTASPAADSPASASASSAAATSTAPAAAATSSQVAGSSPSASPSTSPSTSPAASASAQADAMNISALTAADLDAQGCAPIAPKLPTLKDWPKVTSRVATDPAIEQRVKDMLAKMTLAEKVGQMTQPEIGFITADEVKEFHIGSVLNGGGSWPDKKKQSAPADWLALADSFWEASRTSNASTVIPVIWGIDAMHGHGNAYGATLFPHNIGLGAAHNPCLIKSIAAATAKQVRTTGQDWVFAPVVAVVRDDRWGRTYESYSENPALVRAYAHEAVMGMQGSAATIGADNVITTAKHFIGDGGTDTGTDQGVTMASEADMINVHGQGYYSALAAGAQTVMVSFNSWTNDEMTKTTGKLHGSKYALTDVLKKKIGFDGVLISDWNGHGQVEGCSNQSCAAAVNAGIDVMMVPEDWKGFITNTITSVESGEIPMARIDDAVSRILRVKVRAGIFEAPKPSARKHAGSTAMLTNAPKALARDAVRQSQVLLKNKGAVLPLPATSKVLVVGKSADNMGNQTGGWTLTWQGKDNTNSDFPNGTTILAGLRDALGEANVTYSKDAKDVDPAKFDAVIAVIGETPYAEGEGDIGARSLNASELYPDDLAVIEAVSGKGAPVITVLISGRPLAVTKELNLSDAFVAAWLPGTEGAGVADLLVKTAQGKAGYTGTLSFSWPKDGCQTPLNAGDESNEPLFPLGYGLRSGEAGSVGVLAGSDLPGC